MKTNFDYKSLKKSYDRKVVRRFKDMKDRFQNADGVKGNPVLYTVYIRDFGLFETGLTVVEAGNVNGEFFMTKGHRHKKPSGEIYILLSGKGKLMLQDSKTRIIELKKDKVNLIPKKAGHRLINTGNKKLEVLTIYSKDTGHDYNFKFNKRAMK